MKLTSVMQKFILHWGEMGSRWGVNRTVAQIHALLYLATQPINAEEIADILGVARSNVSTSIKELQSWGLVKVIHVFGDRRDHFESHKDVWEIFRIIVEERKRREIDPTLSVLRECTLEAEDDKKTSTEVKERIRNTLEFLELLTDWYKQTKNLPQPLLAKFLQLGSKLQGWLGKS